MPVAESKTIRDHAHAHSNLPITVLAISPVESKQRAMPKSPSLTLLLDSSRKMF